MIKPLEITVTYTKGNVTVDNLDAVIHPEDQKVPSEINWIVKNCPDDLHVKIAWDLYGPFEFIEEVVKGSRVIGRVNNEYRGVFNYSVLFVNEKGQIVDGCDPRVWNGTNPP